MNTTATTSTGLVRFFKTGVHSYCPNTDTVRGWIVVETEDTNPHEQVDAARASCDAMVLESVYARTTFYVQSSADVRESGRRYAGAFAAASAAARVWSSCLRYLGFARNAISPSPARSSVLTWRTMTPPLPTTAPPHACAISSSVNGPAVGAAGIGSGMPLVS